ncbi:splicing factor U2af large subunit A isoform X2 [Prunus dulcis]|uniref:splicing factor U2af large subunit A isoform X2 n=1 Tax=Prunus dulcis TaxID=3755 RepID=UPI0014831E7F|nr:splicing factor U2af large subunit A isoform X2 [Prunus dulcis]
MSISSRLQEKNRKSSGISLHNDEESAARTRPFSCEEIMLRRNNKKLCDNAIDLGNIPRESIVENVSDRFESEGDYGHHKDLLPFVEKSVSEEAVKASSRKKETYNSKSAKTEVDFAKRKDRGGHESESLKDKPKKDTRTEAKGGKTEKQVHIRKKVDKRSIDNFPNESVKKHSRDSKGKERHGDLSRGNSERESKRKYQNGNEDKIRDRNAPKKHDPGKHHLVEVSERKERKESSKSRLEKSRLKRGRSRSRDREDRHGFRSVSPRAQKYTSHNLGMRSEIHVLKDRSERQHSDIDRSRVSSNGSSSHYRRHGVPENRLGGYSPRKRRTESAIKTPSPPDRSPEKKRARWDHPPTATDKVLSGSVASLFNSSNSNMSSNVHEMAIAVAVASATRKSISGASPNSLLSKKNVSIDSVQLTQATRPMRRLCVENVPSSTSENTLVESLNNFLLSSGVNHIQGTRPCISCSINKEKGQAVVEFLTPEDALAALSFDGSDFSGSILKIRRPKDFVEVSTGDPDKSMAVVETISDVVKDSPNKIFIGGISKSLSSEMYVDQSVTLKACAGLNGMKLGGRVLTAVQAIHDASSLENSGNASLHEIPEYAKPLLKQPSQVLKLRNVLNLEHISLLSEPEVEEVLEDVRLECARFGTVKSVKVVKHCNNYVTTGVFEAVDDAESGGYQNILEFEQKGAKTDTLEEHIDNKFVEFPSNAKEVKEDEVTKGSCFSVTALDDEPTDDFMEEKSCKMGQFGDDIEIKGSENPSNRVPEQLHNQLNSTKDASKCFDVKATEAFEINDSSLENKLMAEEERSTQEEADGEKLRSFAGKDCSLETESDANEKIEIKEQNHGKEHDYDLGSIFEPGCVFVEFGRIEASLMAAHCLHGRVFEDRIVTVEYISLDHYRAHFKIEHV